MKKIFVVLMALVLCLLAFAACDNGKNPPEVTYDVNAAVTYVSNLYKNKGPETAADFEVTSKVQVGGISYDVEWTATEGVTITKKDENTYTVDINEKATEAYEYTLTATVKAGDGTTAKKEFKFSVPKYELLSFEQYMAAKEGDNVTIEGIVVAINSKAAGNSRNHLFLADANVVGGYYSYQMDADPVADLGIEVGMTVTVTGPVAPYSGMQEIKGGVAKIVDSTKKEYAPVDITDKVAAGESLKNYVGLPVTIKGVEIAGQELGGTSEYLKFKLGDTISYIRTYVTDFPTTLKAEDKAAIDAAHAAKYGWKANVTGILVLYNNNPYLIPMTTDCFEYLEKIEKTNEQKVQEELDALTIPTFISKDTTLELPLKGANYADVTLAWTVDNTAFTIGADGKMEIKLGAAGVTIKLTVAATCGDKTVTREIEVKISASVVLSTTKPYIPSLFQAKLDGGKRLYLDGTFGARYLNTTEDPTKAVAVYAETAEGGYKFYILVDGAKNYVYLYKNSDSKDAVKFDAENASVFSYNADVNAWVTDYNGSQYYLGTYNTFNTVSCSKLSYITAENTGVDQFPLEYTPVVEGVAMNGTLFQAKLDGGKTLYLDGTFGARYLNTTEDVSKAVAIYAEKAEGGYKFYILVDGAKQYLYLYKNSDNKGAVKFDAENANVFKFDGNTNAWVTVYDNGDYYLGTYNTFNTVSSSKTSYITAENTGVDQFPLNYVLAGEVAPAGPSFIEIPIDSDKWDQCVLKENWEGKDKVQYRGFAAGSSHNAGGFMFRYGEGNTVAATDITGMKYLEFDVFVTNVADLAEVAFSFELTSCGGSDAQESAKQFKGKDTGWVNGWNHVKWELTEFSVKNGEFDPTKWNFIRWYNDSTLTVGSEKLMVAIANIKFTNGVAAPEAPETPSMPAKPTGDALATFTFGDNGEAAHEDGQDLGEKASYTSGDYKLDLTGMSKVYGPATDAKGNSCIKMGTSSKTGTFSFTVAEGVNKVVIRVAAYKANNAKVVVNGTEYDISANKSNDGSYFEIVIDTTTNKTVTFATVDGACRAMVDSIAYYA